MSSSVTISPHVLTDIIIHTTLEVPGVARMGTVPAKHVAERLRRSAWDHGVVIRMDGSIQADLYLIAQYDVNLLDLGTEVQAAVVTALSELVGLPVQEVNIVIQDVESGSG